MTKAVMFDCYNTLLFYRSDEEKDGIWEQMKKSIEYMTEHQLLAAPEELATLYYEACAQEEQECVRLRGQHAEVSFTRVWRNVLTMLKLPYEIADEKAEDVLLLYRILTRKKKQLFPNVKEELMELKKRGKKLLLLSNAQTCFIRNELPEEIRTLFDVVMISECEGLKKPSEELFFRSFERLELEPEETVFVGDSVGDDVIPSGKLGCHSIMIGKQLKKDEIQTHAVSFDPYCESGYTGLADLVDALDMD